MAEDRMPGCSWTAIVVAPGERVQGKLRTLLIRTQGNHKPHSPLRMHPKPPYPARVEREGWSDYSIPGALLNRDLPPHCRPRPYSKGQASSRHHSGQARYWMAKLVLPVAQPLLHIFGLFLRNSRGVSFWARVVANSSPRGATSPATTSVLQAPPPTHTHTYPPPSQSVAWLLSSRLVFLLSSPFLCLIY